MRRLAKFVGCLMLLLLLGAAAFSVYPRVLRVLITGWWSFLQRNLQTVTFNSSLVFSTAVYALCFFLFATILLKGFLRRVAGAPPSKANPRKIAFIALVSQVVMFTTIVAASGVFRIGKILAQEGISSQERLTPYSAFKPIEVQINMLAYSERTNSLDVIHSRLFQEEFRGRNAVVGDVLTVVLYPGKSNVVGAAVLIPRDKSLFKKQVFGVFTEDEPLEIFPMAELDSTISYLEQRFTK